MQRALTLLACCALATTLAAQMKVKPAPTQRGNSPLAVKGPTAAPTVDSVKRINRAEAQKMLKSGQAIMVDVRSHEQFTLGHIKGAVSIPGSQLLQRVKELPPGKTIIAYCA